jgi:nucleotide-binding universal stress UspA family protein
MGPGGDTLGVVGVVVGTDGSRAAAAAVRHAARIARDCGAALHVVASSRGPSGETIRAAAAVAHEQGIPARLHALRMPLSAALLEVAEREQAEMIVVQSSGAEMMLRRLSPPDHRGADRLGRSSVFVLDGEGVVGRPEPMAIRIDRSRRGLRLYVCRLRVHRSRAGEFLLDGLRRGRRVGSLDAGVLLLAAG